MVAALDASAIPVHVNPPGQQQDKETGGNGGSQDPDKPKKNQEDGDKQTGGPTFRGTNSSNPFLEPDEPENTLPVQVPEPPTLWLIAAGLAVLPLARRHRLRRRARNLESS